MSKARTCAFPTLKHPGYPVLAVNFEIRDNLIYQKCPETGRYFEAKVALVRYKCCGKTLLWIEKDHLPNGEVLDLRRSHYESH